MFVCLRTALKMWTGRGRGVVFLCESTGWGGATVRAHTPDLQPVVYIQYHPPFSCPDNPNIQRKTCSSATPPTPIQDKSEEEDKELDSFGSGGGGRANKNRWTRNNPPWRQWILQERSELVDMMVAKRRRKMKEGRAYTDPAAATLEGVQKLSNGIRKQLRQTS